jgi:hypothetical protein
MSNYDTFLQAYFRPSFIQNVRVSVGFAKKESLPKHLFTIGAEMDTICKETGGADKAFCE